MAGEFKPSLLWLGVACVVLVSSSMQATESTTAEPSSTPDSGVSPTPPHLPSSTTKPEFPSTATQSTVALPTPTPSTTTQSPVGTSKTTPSTATQSPVGTSKTIPSTATQSTVGTSKTTPSTATQSTVALPTTTPSTTTQSTVALPTTTPSTTTQSTVGTSKTTPSTTTQSTVGTSKTTPSTATHGSVGSTTDLVSSSTTALGPCEKEPCGQGSTCEVRAETTFVCLCLPGENYDYIRQRCETAKVFPGQLNLPNMTYNPLMQDKESPEFNNASQIIIDELATVFTAADGFSNATVLALEPREQRQVRSAQQPGITASIEILFTQNSTITTSEINSKIVNASQCEGCLLAGTTFTDTNLCENNPCDNTTTTKCESKDGNLVCTCRAHHIKTESVTKCMACSSSQQTKDSLECVDCEFGYSGLHCSESWKLALVIVGSVLGGLLLITLILLPIIAVKCSKKKTKKSSNHDIGKPYVTHFPAKLPLVNGASSLANSQAPSLNGSAYGSAGVPKIPRATTTTSSWDSRTNLEMVPSNSRQNLITADRNSRLYDDHDDMSPYTQSRPQSNLYAQARPRNNPYAQDRPQISPYAQDRAQNNPYAQNQGQTNPYYAHNNEKWSN